MAKRSDQTPEPLYHLGTQVTVQFGRIVGTDIQPLEPLVLNMPRLDDASFTQLRDLIDQHREKLAEG